MNKILFLLIIVPLTSYANCDLYIIGFGGLNNHFDHQSFKFYAEKKNACYKSFKWSEQVIALNYINQLNTDFELYGFSKGAETVSKLIKQYKIKPSYILTIGAYKTTDVDFTKYNIKFQNYFDHSGIGQKSPGIFIKNIHHLNMQKHINKLLD